MINDPIDTVIVSFSSLPSFWGSGGVQLRHVQVVFFGRQNVDMLGDTFIQCSFHVSGMKLGSDSDRFQVDGADEMSQQGPLDVILKKDTNFLLVQFFKAARKLNSRKI